MIDLDLALQVDFPRIIIPVNYRLTGHDPVLDCLENFLLQFHHIFSLAILLANYFAHRASENILRVPNIQLLDLV